MTHNHTGEETKKECKTKDERQKGRKLKNICFISQNVRGIKSTSRLEDLFNSLSLRKNVWGMCLQETWRFEHETLDYENYKLITNGLEKTDDACNRGSQGVGIVLNSDGISAWEAAGYEKHIDYGARIIAIRLCVKDKHKRDVGIFLVSAYAPVGNAPDHIWDEYLEKFTNCINKKHNNDMLIVGSDCNASVGRATINDNGPLGKFGLSYRNTSGLRFVTHLAIHEIKVATTCFTKKLYATWTHPRSKNKHQIDHFLVNTEMFHRIADAGTTKQVIDSDHGAIMIKLRIMKRLKKKSTPRNRLLNLDYTVLNDETVNNNFCEKVKLSAPVTHTEFIKSVKSACHSLLPIKSKAHPGWFEAQKDTLTPLINTRNEAMQKVLKRRTRQSSEKLKQACKQLKREVKIAKNKWIDSHCNNINDFGTKKAWDSIKILKGSLMKIRPSVQKQMKKTDGSVCQTPKENADVFFNHFKNLFDQEGSYDPTVLDELPQHQIQEGYDHHPTDEEIRKAILKLKNNAPGESGVMSQPLKALLNHPDTFIILQKIVSNFWNTETVPDEWNIGRLIVLPKKGDLSLPKNYRGIMLLKITYKIIANILHSRLLPIEEQLDHEQQCGFRPNRGCIDAIFTIKSAIKKRSEHGLESWVLFLDLVKAFDRVPRKLLWDILLKYGVPPKLVNVLKALHNSFAVKIDNDLITEPVNNSIGVKQGDILGPVLFTFFITAAISSWRVKCSATPCVFMTKNDAQMTGRPFKAHGEPVTLLDSEYADDTAVIFDNRNDAVGETESLISHFNRFGTEIHSGVREPRQSSKTEVLFCAKALSLYESRDDYDNADLTDIVLTNNRYIPIVNRFTYLGSIITTNGTDDLDIETRIRKAGNAFGSLRKSIFSSCSVNYCTKGKVYCSFILPILLYGSECWSLC